MYLALRSVKVLLLWVVVVSELCHFLPIYLAVSYLQGSVVVTESFQVVPAVSILLHY